MKLIIDIPEEIYQHYKKVWQKRRGSIPESCIAFGTPLPKGHWIEMPIGFKCSKCNELEDKTTKYCPNCGARMESEETNE